MYAQFVVARGVTVAPTGYFFLSHEALQGNMKILLQMEIEATMKSKKHKRKEIGQGRTIKTARSVNAVCGP